MLRIRTLPLVAVLALSACIGSSSDQTLPVPSRSTSLRDLVTPGSPRWRALAPAPQARQEVAATTLGRVVYVAGGLTAAGATNRVDLYSMAADKWSAGPPLPEKVHHATAATLGDTVIVIGGFDASSRPSAKVWALVAGAWKPMAALSEPRAAAVAVVVAGKIFVLGGQGIGRLVAQVEVFEPIPKGAPGVAPVPSGQWVRKASIPTPRHHVAAAADGKRIWVSGGRVPAGGAGPDRNVAAFEVYDPAKDAWSKLPNVPTARSGHGSGFIKGRVVVVGGEDPGVEGPSIVVTEDFDPATGAWGRRFPGMFRPRHGVGTAIENEALYVLVGGSRTGGSPSEDVDVLVSP